MKSSIHSCIEAREKCGVLCGSRFVFLAVLVGVCLGLARTASAQVVYHGDKGGFGITAGATASGYEVQYGQQKLLGVAGVVDIDSHRRLGLEGEGRWLLFNGTNQVQATTYMGGPRYRVDFGSFQVYGKGLVGVSQFTFPYNYAQGNYLVIAPGGGIDYRWKRRISFRLADFEYQIWPQFTYGSMSSYGVSAGVLYHIY